MGFMDNLVPDTPIEIKQPDYYRLVRETAKGELLMNGIKAGVPARYMEAIATGEIREGWIDGNAEDTD